MTDTRLPLRRFSSGGPYEASFGYSRAVRAGDRILVSGCTSLMNDAVRHPGNAGAQMRVALDNALNAVAALDGGIADVIRTRMYVVNRSDADAVGRVHGERFADVRPAATMVLVAGLIDEAMLVEVELEACVGLTNPADPAEGMSSADPADGMSPADPTDPAAV